MMVDTLGMVRKIVDVAVQIEAAVGTVRRNKEDCDEIGRRVSSISDSLSKMENLEGPATTSHALENLDETLRKALKLVRVCQKDTGFQFAGNLAKELRHVNQRIINEMAAANLPTQDADHLGVVESSSSSPSNSDTRFEADGARKCDPSRMKNLLNQSGFRMFSLSELKAATNDFSEKNMIGKGGSATVYKGAISDILVAIKRFRTDRRIQRDIEHYVNVFALLPQHQNIVRFLGYCQETTYEKVLYKGHYVDAETTSMMVVEEYIANGTLSDIINGRRLQLDWSIRFQIIQGMAQGISHLHKSNIIHMDLKPDNILVDSDMTPKICDFEICKILDQQVTQEVTEELVGTLGYMAPEYIAEGIISAKNDVYSFGLLVLSTIRGMSWSGLGQHAIEWAWEVREAQSVKELLDSASGGKSQLQQVERSIDIGLLCSQDDPMERPTMMDVLKMLNSEERPPAPPRPSFI